MTNKIPTEQFSCRFGKHWNEFLGERWMGSCPMFECTYNGDKEIPVDMECDETNKCPVYEPVEVFVCKKHDQEYFDICIKCEDEEEAKMRAAENIVEQISNEKCILHLSQEGKEIKND